MIANITFVVVASNPTALQKFRALDDEEFVAKIPFRLLIVTHSKNVALNSKGRIHKICYVSRKGLSLSNRSLNLPLTLLAKAVRDDPFGTEFFFYVNDVDVLSLLRSKSRDIISRFLEDAVARFKAVYFTEMFFGVSRTLMIRNYYTIQFARSVRAFFTSIENEGTGSGCQPFKFPKVRSVKSTLQYCDSMTPREFMSDLQVSIYILSYNSPDQFIHLLKTFRTIDNSFLSDAKKYLIDNSTDNSIIARYEAICRKYGFEHLKMGNLGISGGRQLAASHFASTESDYYTFFEDDMSLSNSKLVCRMGFPKFVPNLFAKSLRAIFTEKLDFLKLSFTEVWGDHSKQWAWNAMPDEIKILNYPDVDTTDNTLTPDALISQIKNIRNCDLSFVTGNIYYSNWPMWMSKAGNEKVFLRNPISSPNELSWMVSVFNLQKAGQMNAGVLLASPIDHIRLYPYMTERKES